MQKRREKIKAEPASPEKLHSLAKNFKLDLRSQTEKFFDARSVYFSGHQLRPGSATRTFEAVQEATFKTFISL